MKLRAVTLMSQTLFEGIVRALLWFHVSLKQYHMCLPTSTSHIPGIMDILGRDWESMDFISGDGITLT